MSFDIIQCGFIAMTTKILFMLFRYFGFRCCSLFTLFMGSPSPSIFLDPFPAATSTSIVSHPHSPKPCFYLHQSRKSISSPSQSKPTPPHPPTCPQDSPPPLTRPSNKPLSQLICPRRLCAPDEMRFITWRGVENIFFAARGASMVFIRGGKFGVACGGRF